MNWQHFRTFLWLRWRLGVNQIKKAGPWNFAFLAIITIGGVIFSVCLFVVALVVGLFTLGGASPVIVMTVWDGVIVGFLFFWMTGLMIELQRSELLSLDKFLHLPVSIKGVFLINYLGSLINLPTIAFLPGMIGFCIALVYTKGVALLGMFPLLAAFFLLVTALTHQFRGWLASMMTNKRRRRTVIAVLTLVFVVIAQTPQLINVYTQRWARQHTADAGAGLREALAENDRALREALAENDRALAEKKIDNQQWAQQQQAILLKNQANAVQNVEEGWQQFEHWATIINMAVPLGWLPYSAMALCRGNVLPALLVTSVMTLIGAASLRRSYRTTLRMYLGKFTSGKARPMKVTAPVKGEKPSVKLLEKRLPWVSEPTSAIAVASFRSVTRAPEAKLMLLSPIILAMVFGGMFFANPMEPPEFARPLMATGGIALMLVTMIQLLGNQFGFDRSGFRTFVLCAAPRRDILLGKNLAFAPLVLGLCLLMVVGLQVIYPMRFDHFLALLPQIVSTYLLYCILANWLSILNPMPIAAGSLKPVQPKGSSVLLQLLFMMLFPLALLPTMLPLGIEFALAGLDVVHDLPIGLVLALALLVGVVFLYRVVLTWQGQALQAREQKILEIVTTKNE